MNKMPSYKASDFTGEAELALKDARDSGQIVQILGDDNDTVFMVPASREQLIHLLEELAVLEGLKEGLEDVKAGRVRPMEEVFDELRNR